MVSATYASPSGLKDGFRAAGFKPAVKKISFLKAAFLSACALLGMGSGLAAGHGMREALRPAEAERHLSVQETRLVQSIFGENFQSQDIRVQARVHDNPFTNAFVIPFSSKVDFWGADYADSGEKGKPADLLLHEVTHVWQNQNQSPLQFAWNYFTNNPRNYAYQIVAGKAFTDYGIEEQAEMVQDYYLAYLAPTPKATPSTETQEIKDLRDLVETQFPAARQSRLQRQAAPATPAPAQKNIGIS